MPLAITMPLDSGFVTVFALGVYTEETPSQAERLRRERTEVGHLVHQAKYWQVSPHTQERARDELGLRLCEIATTHELCCDVDAVVAIPGHDLRQASFSQRLGRDVATALDRPLVAISAKAEYRPSLKERRIDLTGFYFFETDLQGQRVLLVDDVYDQGDTMGVAARAALEAGARGVVGLVAAQRA